MKKKRIVIIGGVAAGMSAASRARKRQPDIEIIAFEKSGFVSYGACGMPYFISDKIKSSNSLIAYDQKFFKEQRNIDIFLHHEVTKILPQKKKVLVKNLSTGEETEYEYDRLLISTGARPFLPPIKGINLAGIFTLRMLEDGIAIKQYIGKNSPRSGIILGAGPIGMEMAESFSQSGIAVTVVEKMPSILGTMDDEIIKTVEDELSKNKVRLIKAQGITGFTGDNGALKKAILEDGTQLDADIAIVGAGIRPNSELAKDAGIELGKGGAIKVTARMETSIPDIYAAGDCAETYHLVLGKPVYIPLALTANKQGRTAGDNMAGEDVSFPGIVGTAVFKVFDLEIGRTGITEKEAKTEGIDYVASTVEHFSRARYYPGANKITVKLVCRRDSGLLLGAQLAGKEGVVQRTNVFAAALSAKMTIQDTANMDLAYAPPFSPVYDAVIIAAEEIEKKLKAIS